jgi:hypothetical protein
VFERIQIVVNDPRALTSLIFRESGVPLRLSLSRDEQGLSISASNGGTHVVRDIEINAIPDAEDWHELTHGRLPNLQSTEAPGVSVVYPIVGGWFHATVKQLNPNRGFTIARFQISENSYTRMDFDVFWNDHQGKQRKSHVVVDVASMQGELPL